MSGIRMVAALALVVGLGSSAARAADSFSEVHMGVEADTRLLSVTVFAKEHLLWRLWPEEVKVDHHTGGMEYRFGYSSNYSLNNAVRAVGSLPGVTAECQKQLSPLLSAPTTRGPEERRTVTVQVQLDEAKAKRLTLRAGEGMAIGDVQQLRSVRTSPATERLTLDAMTRFISVQLAYRATYSVDLTPSELSTELDLASGDLRIRPWKTGYATLKNFAAIGSITPNCWALIDERYNGSPLEPASTPNLHPKRASVWFAIPANAPRTLQLKPAAGLTVEKVEEYE